MMKKHIFVFMIAIIPHSVMAYDWHVTTRVSQIEISFVPDAIPIYVDKPAGNCPANTALQWNPRGTDVPSKIANSQAVLSALMLAKAGSREIEIFGSNTNCKIEFIYLR